jgi:transglutaminase-like putative cysteine protease/thiol-disulfide isomerase/thioredoxin
MPRANLPPLADGRRRALLAAVALAAAGVRAADGAQRQPWPTGRPTPDIDLPTWEGPPFHLAGARGQVVVLNFWASWCEPCRAEMPSLELLAQRHERDGLQVVAVNFRETDGAIRRFLEQTPLSLPILRTHLSEHGGRRTRRPRRLFRDRRGRLGRARSPPVDQVGVVALISFVERTAMNPPVSRRSLLQAGLAASLPLAALAQERRFEPQVGPWRRFEVSTRVTVAEPQGTTRLWLPLPDIETDWQRTLDNDWSGNADRARVVADPQRGVRMLYAEFASAVTAPVITLTSRLQTRNRAVDWQRPGRFSEDPAALRVYTGPTELQPLDGIVRNTALEATRGAATELGKVRALYDWVVAHAHREPKTRGCGTGDIKAMLETGNLGGKCADINALFVGLCRAVGIPARDVYGLRLAPSAFGYRELGASPANLKGAQHCRAEVFLKTHGWVAMDPADVLKVMRQETAEWIKDPKHPLVAPVMAGLFGRWEGNWVGWNTAHDITLPGSAAKGTLPFLMYPSGENASGAFDSLSPDSFRYTITAREIA